MSTYENDKIFTFLKIYLIYPGYSYNSLPFHVLITKKIDSYHELILEELWQVVSKSLCYKYILKILSFN